MSILLRALERRSVGKRRKDLPVFRELLALQRDSRLLDLGGGAGTATASFAEGCDHVVVLEPDRRKARYGRSRHPNLRFVRGIAEALPFPDATFDRVSAVVSFHHVADRGRVLREVRRVLRPGGRLALHELYPDEHLGCLRRILAKRIHGSAPAFLRPDELREILGGHGFDRVTAHDGVHGYFVTGER